MFVGKMFVGSALRSLCFVISAMGRDVPLMVAAARTKILTRVELRSRGREGGYAMAPM